MSIEEMNKTIAEFMGLIVVPAGTKAIGKIKVPEISEALNYERDWNDLMTVIEKIKSISDRFVLVQNLNSVILRSNHEKLFEIHIHETGVSAVHSAVYNFCEWYLKQQKSFTHTTTQ